MCKRRPFQDASAESKGFELLVGCPTPDFESGTFGHSVSSPPATLIHRASDVQALKRCGWASQGATDSAAPGRDQLVMGAAGGDRLVPGRPTCLSVSSCMTTRFPFK